MSDKYQFEEPEEGIQGSFAELPVPAATLRWSRGDARLRVLKDTDPGLYFGGWRTRVKKFKGKDGEKNPAVPLPIVTRTDTKGSSTFDVYATNVLHFIPIRTRMRFELREKEFVERLGFDAFVVKRISLTKKDGWSPMHQIFGLVFNATTEEHAPALLWVDMWNAHISYGNAFGVWQKAVARLATKGVNTVIRKYGSIGKLEKDTGLMLPNMVEFKGGTSTPIEAIGIDNPRFYDLTEELQELQFGSLAWGEDPLWLKEGSVKGDNTIVSAMEEVLADPFLQMFSQRAREIGLTNIEIEDLLASSKHDYEKAYDEIKPEAPEIVSAPGSADLGNPFAPEV